MPERDFELPDAETLAYQMSEAVADQEATPHRSTSRGSSTNCSS
jgi:hypothetical protein